MMVLDGDDGSMMSYKHLKYFWHFFSNAQMAGVLGTHSKIEESKDNGDSSRESVQKVKCKML